MSTFQVSVREARMCVERILLWRGLPSGAVYGVREAILASQSLGLGGFAWLLERHAELDWSAHARVKVEDRADATLAFDGGGAHAWIVLPTLVDLAVDLARRNGTGRAYIENVREPRELAAACALAKRHGATGELSGPLLTLRNAAQPATAAQWDPLLDAAMKHGYDVPGQTWQAVHELSNGALAPDSVASRRHAGPVVLAEDGRLLGRVPQDDDFDMNMLKKVAS